MDLTSGSNGLSEPCSLCLNLGDNLWSALRHFEKRNLSNTYGILNIFISL